MLQHEATKVISRDRVKRRISGSMFRAPLFMLATLPALYFFFAVQHGAITVPWWDGCVLMDFLAPWYAGNFHLSSLWAPLEEARPVVYRVVMGVNAVLTNWDVRSEFNYIYASFYGVFALHALALRKVTANAPQNSFVFPLSLLIMSLIVFSPVSHADQWWSLMLILDGANLLIVLSLLIVFLRPESSIAHIVAAAICWAASYTFASGMFAMLAVVVVFQLSSMRVLRANGWAVFWAANLAVLLICYLPGIGGSMPGGIHNHHLRPSPLQMSEFAFIYLGLPFHGLLSFPYQSIFDLPAPILFNALCGVVLVAFSALLCWHGRSRLRACNPAALILFGFTIFALISAVITAWGRANIDQYNVRDANASRYTLFSAYLMLGQLYYLAAGFSEGWWRHKILAPAATLAAITFACLSAISYDKAITVYNNAYWFNREVASAYSWDNESRSLDSIIYPDPTFFMIQKRNMQRLELGPYSDRETADISASPAGSYNSFVMLSGGRQISQDFIARKAGLKDISITLAKPNFGRTAGILQWQLSAVGNSEPVASGTLNEADVKDWEVMRLKLPYLPDSEGREYRISFSGFSDDSHALAMPLYAQAAGKTPTVTLASTGNEPQIKNLSMNIVLSYAD